MYKVIFYTDRNGKSEINEYIQKLAKERNVNKDTKIKFEKIIAYLNLLEKNGLGLKEPYIKYIGNSIWELRPLRYRILFAKVKNNKFILLSYFIKKTQKTPKREIEKALKNLKKYKIEVEDNE